jgi:hypothetical protein
MLTSQIRVYVFNNRFSGIDLKSISRSRLGKYCIRSASLAKPSAFTIVRGSSRGVLRRIFMVNDCFELLYAGSNKSSWYLFFLSRNLASE